MSGFLAHCTRYFRLLSWSQAAPVYHPTPGQFPSAWPAAVAVGSLAFTTRTLASVSPIARDIAVERLSCMQLSTVSVLRNRNIKLSQYDVCVYFQSQPVAVCFIQGFIHETAATTPGIAMASTSRTGRRVEQTTASNGDANDAAKTSEVSRIPKRLSTSAKR